MAAPTNALAVSSSDKLKAIMRAPETLSRFAEILGQHNAPAYVTSVLLAVANNEQLQKCSPASIITSAMRAATLRLSCDPSTKQAHLVPFKDKATLVVGHKGYYDMANRTGKYRYLNDFRVYEGQEVVEDQLRGTVEIIGSRTSGTVIGYGFYFEMLNGLRKVLYMTVEEIREHGAKYSKTYNYPSSLWKVNFDAMARKTVTRLCLSRYGYLDPTDAMTLSSVDESEIDDSELERIQPPPRRRMTQSQIMRELGYDDDPGGEIVDMETGEILDASESADATAPEQADPYQDLKTLAETEPATAFWQLQARIGWSKADAQAIAKECKQDMAKAFASLLRNAPPAMI
jgi:recombination protein RecT